MMGVELSSLVTSVPANATEVEMSEFQQGVDSERKRIAKILHRYRAEGLEIVHVKNEPGVNTSAVRRFDTDELVRRIWEEAGND